MPLPPVFELVRTDDGSPSLAHRRPDGHVEWMHHRGGAWAESVFVYGVALERALAMVPAPRVLSLGLGLGYNEVLAIARLTAANRAGTVTSFEAEPFLRDEFARWLIGDESGALAPVYAAVTDRAGVDANVVRRFANAGRIELRGAFPGALPAGARYDVVFYDAYSNKMDAALWDEETLVRVFGEHLASTSVLATYAATGALNRVLRRLGFKNQNRPGFGHRRESTLAVRTGGAP